jgi:hypothetical protein
LLALVEWSVIDSQDVWSEFHVTKLACRR